MPPSLDSTHAATQPVNATAIRDELLGLLQKAGSPSEAAQSANSPEPAAVEGNIARAANSPPSIDDSNSAESGITCPQCNNTESWGGASWCPRCGYYPKLGHAGEIPAEESDELTPLEFADFVPDWLPPLMGGGVAIVAGTWLMQRLLLGQPGFLSLASLLQLTVGLLVLLCAHYRALLASLNTVKNATFVNLLVYPPTVWLAILKHHQQHGRLLIAGGCSLVAMIAGLSIYGPIRMQEISTALKEARAQREAALLQGNGTSGSMKSAMAVALQTLAGTSQNISGAGAASIEESLHNLAGTSQNGGAAASGESSQTAAGEKPAEEPQDNKPPKPSPADKQAGDKANDKVDEPSPAQPIRPQHPQAIVFGYLTNGSGEIRTLLLARTGPNGRPVFAGRLDHSSVPSDSWESLKDNLPLIRTSRPLVACPNDGYWVQPSYVLTIEASRWRSTGPADPIVHEVSKR